MGDNGEIKAFFDNRFGDAKAKDTFTINQTKDNCEFKLLGAGNDVLANAGMVNFERTMGQAGAKDYFTGSQSWIILGDMAYTEHKGLSNNDGTWKTTDGMNNDAMKTHMGNRLRCAWAIFYRALKFLATKHTITVDGSKLQVLPGNHAFDVDFQGEAMGQLTGSLNPAPSWVVGNTSVAFASSNANVSVWLKSIRTTTIEDGQAKVVYIDINSHTLICAWEANEQAFQSCMRGKWVIVGTFGTLEHAVSHRDAIFAALEKDYGQKVHKVMRAHQAPFNVEGDFEPYFQKKHPTKNKTILEAMQAAGVQLFIASHHHSAELMAFNYSTDISGKKKFDAGAKDTNKTCLQAHATTGALADCGSTAYSLSVKQTFASPKYLFVAVVGNTGRYFDPIWTDKYSYGKMLWGRAMNKSNDPANYKTLTAENYYGFAQISFTLSKITVKFYEVKVASGPATPTNPDNVATLEIIDNATADTLTYVDSHNTSQKTAGPTRRKNKKSLLKKK